MPTLIRWWEVLRAPGKVVEVSSVLERYRWPKWRSSADSLGYFVGDGEVQILSRERRIGSIGAGLSVHRYTSPFFSCTVHVFNDVQSHHMAQDEPLEVSVWRALISSSYHPL